MKRVIYLTILWNLNLNSSSQTLSLKEIENDLLGSYLKIISARFDSVSIEWDTLESENIIFREKLKKYTSDYPVTLTIPFESFRPHISIITSEDKLFRIYSWDTWLGGTMHIFDNLLQFRSGEYVFSHYIHDTVEYSNDKSFCSEIHTLQTNTNVYYLAIKNWIYSSKDAGQSIKAFTVEDNMVNDTVKIFRVGNEVYNELWISFDFFRVVDRPERPVKLITFDKANGKVSIPIADDEGKITGKMNTYKFAGRYFE